METFARPQWLFGNVRRTRIAAAVSLLMLTLGLVGVIRRLSGDNKRLLFDVGVGAVSMAAIHAFARRLIAHEADGQRRAIAAVLIGVTAAAASQGIFAVTVAGKPAGIEQLPALVVVQWLGAVGGAGLGFFTSFFASALVVGVQQITKRETTAVDGAFIGALSGLLGGLTVLHVPHLGGWFVFTSTVVSTLAGLRAVGLYRKAELRSIASRRVARV